MILTAPRVGSGANETMRGTPTAARKWTDVKAAKVQGSHFMLTAISTSLHVLMDAKFRIL